jgi:hypothetical protein
LKAAIESGRENLEERKRSLAMLDISSARWDENSRVTPLPILRA